MKTFNSKRLRPLIACLLGLLAFAKLEAETVIFLYALDADWRALEASGAVVRKVERIGGSKIQVARLGAHVVVAAPLGAGQVESAVVLAGVLARYPADRILTTGAAGGIAEGFVQGSVVVVDRIQNWQVGTEGGGGWREAERAQIEVRPWRLDEIGAVSNWPKVKTASAEVFVASEAERARLRGLTRAEVVDMNLYGLEKANGVRDLPALHLRVISDLANEEAGATFGDFVASYDGVLGRKAAELIGALGVGAEAPEAHPELRALRGGR